MRFVIIGGGPAGNTAATYAARLGAKVTMIERDVIGGAAHLWDCIPSKTMIATGGAMSFSRRIDGMGLEQADPEVDVEGLISRIEGIKSHLQKSTTTLLESQGVELIRGVGALHRPEHVDGRDRRGHRGARVRLRAGLDRIEAPRARLVLPRRRPDPHHARLLPAEDVPRRASPSSAPA